MGKRLLLDKVENRLLSTTRILKPLGTSSPVALVCYRNLVSGYTFTSLADRRLFPGDNMKGVAQQ